MKQRTIQQISLLSKLPLYMAMKARGIPSVFPRNIAMGLLYACNPRCKTCHVYEKSLVRSVFACNYGQSPLSRSVSGILTYK